MASAREAAARAQWFAVGPGRVSLLAGLVHAECLLALLRELARLESEAAGALLQSEARVGIHQHVVPPVPLVAQGRSLMVSVPEANGLCNWELRK